MMILAERPLPKRTRTGLQLPGSEQSPVVVPRNGHDDVVYVHVGDAPQPRELFRALLSTPRPSQECVHRTLKDLHAEEALVQKVLVYGSYIVEYLYLEKPSVSATDADKAARIANVLLRYWQEHEAQGNNQAANALPLLWRCYWRALAMIVNSAEHVAQTRDEIARLICEPEYSWLATWYPLLQTEYPRALRTWQAISVDQQRAYLFAEQLAPWLNTAPGKSVRSWQQIRECEVKALIWNDSTFEMLRPPGGHTAAGRRWLRQLGDQWLVARYDLTSATRLHWQINRTEGKSRILSLLLVIPIGASRIWAGSGIGYISTMLQGDTWKALWWMLSDADYRGIVVGMGLPLLTVLYLAYEINRQTGVAAIQRAIILACKGEVFAIILALAAVMLLGPLFVDEITPPPTLGEWFLIACLYAQFALTIGIFTQLIFDDRRTTDPLDFHSDTSESS